MDEKYLEMAGFLSAADVAAGIARARFRPRKPSDFDGYCGCGEEIPPERIALDFFICVECKAKDERKQRRR